MRKYTYINWANFIRNLMNHEDIVNIPIGNKPWKICKNL